MYCEGKALLGVGYWISAAANALPTGGSGGMMDKLDIRLEVPLGAGGRTSDVNVLASSCKVNK